MKMKDKNVLYVVGLGPGEAAQMTQKAAEVLKSCDVIVGYDVYVDLVRGQYPNKEYITSPMTKEPERCKAAIASAASGKKTAVVCSGDAGVYGMAGLVLELAEGEDVEVDVVAGITAALSGGAVLGAPLGHDFAVISLSDLLTPWTLIEKRLDYAARCDLAICLYNPSSKKRHDYLSKACDILLQSKDKSTVCGLVQNIGREGEGFRVLTLEQLKDTQVDMFTTVFIGNAQTKEIGGRMVTPRGYRDV